MRWFLIVAAIWVVVYVFRLLVSFAVDRGWLYGKGQGPVRGNSVGYLGFEEVFQPSIEYVLEESDYQEIRADQDESGEDL